jgi:hypothetical protein
LLQDEKGCVTNNRVSGMKTSATGAKGNTEVDREQVQEAITTAFAGLPIPKPRTLIQSLHPDDRLSGEEFRKELAGKSWQSLTPELLAEQWSRFSYLSPKAYRYYLPALLIAALQEVSDNNSLMHTAAWHLRPSFWLLYHEGKDDDLIYQQSAFTPAQYCAVCAFLGFLFDQLPQLPHWRHLAAQALHWGWNRYETPELEAANKYYQEMRTFSYPEPDNPEVVPLCQEIRSAFAATPYPGDNELIGDYQITQDNEPAEYAMELRGVKWQLAHPQLLARCALALAFLTDAGYRYFLPAFLLANLLADYEDRSNADPVSDLTHGFYDERSDEFNSTDIDTGFESYLDELGLYDHEKQALLDREKQALLEQSQEPVEKTDWRAYSIDRFRLFNREERMAIIHYLEFSATDEYDAPRIKQALEEYWRPSVEE